MEENHFQLFTKSFDHLLPSLEHNVALMGYIFRGIVSQKGMEVPDEFRGLIESLDVALSEAARMVVANLSIILRADNVLSQSQMAIAEGYREQFKAIATRWEAIAEAFEQFYEFRSLPH